MFRMKSKSLIIPTTREISILIIIMTNGNTEMIQKWEQCDKILE